MNTPTTLTFTLTGDPIPQGSHRIVGPRGRGRIIDGNRMLLGWRNRVAIAAHQASVRQRGWVKLDGPLRLAVVFTVRKPVRAPKTRTTWPVAKPDLDKLVRAIGDALTQSGSVWNDDAQVVAISAVKRYPSEGPGALSEPGALITVSTLQGAA